MEKLVVKNLSRALRLYLATANTRGCSVIDHLQLIRLSSTAGLFLRIFLLHSTPPRTTRFPTGSPSHGSMGSTGAVVPRVSWHVLATSPQWNKTHRGQYTGANCRHKSAAHFVGSCSRIGEKELAPHTQIRNVPTIVQLGSPFGLAFFEETFEDFD